MRSDSIPSNPQSDRRDRIFRLGLLLICTLFSLGALIFPYSLRQISFPLKAGDVAPQDIQAPYALTYQSTILTEQAKVDALKSIQPIFLPIDPAISRLQIEKLKAALAYISNIRADAFSTQAQKINDLGLLSEIQIRQEIRETILSLNDSRWQTIQQETINVLEQVMRNTIREGQVSQAQRNVASLISFSISQDQAIVVSELVIPFITPNSLLSQEQTNAAQQEAISKLKPVERTYATGEIIVRRGQIISPTAFEALQAYGLIQNQSGVQNIIASISLAGIAGALAGLYVYRRRISVFSRNVNLLLMALFFLFFLFSARFIIPNRTILPYLFPLTAFGLTIGSLFSMEVGLVFSIFLALLTGYGMPNSLELIIFYILTSLSGILILGKGRRIINFFWVSIAIGVTGGAVILSFRLPEAITDAIGLATLTGVSFLNGLASASLTLLFQFLFAQILGMTTSLQLLDLSRPDHPLLQFLLRNAPGTYQHSLLVANLAEQAAEAISADSLLVRVGCLYHDIGKALNPSFFIENQVPGKIDSHDDLEPTMSASTIIHHVTDGIELAKKHRIPLRIRDFIREHHGTLLTQYQYARALEQANSNSEEINADLFRYPGPKPRSRETVILMLADGCEAKARADLPKNEDDLRKLVRKVVDYLQSQEQFDETALTLKDLHTVTESFIKTLLNTYHPRLTYPEIRSAQITTPIQKTIKDHENDLETEKQSQNAETLT